MPSITVEEIKDIEESSRDERREFISTCFGEMLKNYWVKKNFKEFDSYFGTIPRIVGKNSKEIHTQLTELYGSDILLALKGAPSYIRPLSIEYEDGRYKVNLLSPSIIANLSAVKKVLEFYKANEDTLSFWVNRIFVEEEIHLAQDISQNFGVADYTGRVYENFLNKRTSFSRSVINRSIAFFLIEGCADLFIQGKYLRNDTNFLELEEKMLEEVLKTNLSRLRIKSIPDKPALIIPSPPFDVTGIPIDELLSMIEGLAFTNCCLLAYRSHTYPGLRLTEREVRQVLNNPFKEAVSKVRRRLRKLGLIPAQYKLEAFYS